MKNPRTVIVTLEIQTTAPMKDLKSKSNWQDLVDMDLVLRLARNDFFTPQKRFIDTDDYPQVKQVTVSVAQSPTLYQAPKK